MPKEVKLKNIQLSQQETVEYALKRKLVYFFIQQLPQLVLSSLLFIGGIVLLSLKIPGWSLIIGLPAVQFGLIFMIFNYDRAANKRVGINSLYSVECPICHKSFLSYTREGEEVCPFCQAKIDLEKQSADS